MSLIGNEVIIGASGQGGDFTIDDSLRFRSSASAYLSRTPSTAGNRKTWTWSGWVKKTDESSGMLFSYYASGADNNYLYFIGGIITYKLEISNVTTEIRTTPVFRDPSSWYHIVLAIDTTQATASNRTKLYVNGNQVTSFSTESYPAQNTNTFLNSNVLTTIGARSDLSSSLFYEGYLTEVNFIDGQALDPTYFGETDEDTGVWKPKRYAGSYGTNGFRLDGSGVTDSSGNGNNWTNNNLNLTTSSATTYDLMTDVPTLTDEDTANYATWNPLDILVSSYIPTYSEGNLKVYHGTRTYAHTNIALPSGKWYAEVELDTHGSGLPTIGFAVKDSTNSTKNTNYISNGNKIVNGTTTSYGSSYTAGDIIGISFDADTGDVTFYKNGVSQGSISNSNLAASTENNVAARIFTGHSGSIAANATWILNAGQRPFAYTPPTGFLKMNTYNLPDSDIVIGAEQFNTVLYTGNGSTQSITGVGFQPDFLWLKRRDSAENHGLHDVIRGSTNFHVSNQNANQYTATNSVTSFDSDGFSLGNYSNTNTNGSSMVAWNWKANGSGVSNTVGSINSTVSANTTAGFSIVQYTGNGLTSSGQTVGHGLGIKPDFIITKLQSGTQYNWSTWHKNLPAATGIWLNLTNGRNTNMWNGTNMTSTVFSPADLAYNNVSGATYINYVFASVEGFSKFGVYTGNGSTDGPFIYTGFRPAFIILKAIDRTGHWTMFDSKRDTYNLVDHQLEPNYSSAESSGSVKGGDFLSNGWKCRSSETEVNQSGYKYLYAAFAENPFKNSLAR